LLQKWENALRLKKELLKEKWNMDFTPEARPWDGIELIISPELQAKLDKNLISAADLKEAIYLAEESGDKLVDEEGQSLASLVKPVVVYWVQYACKSGVYEVATAYSHRIKWRA